MAKLIAAFPDFAVVVEDWVQGADRAVIDPLVQQGGVDLRRRQVGEARLAQPVEHRPSFFGRQRAGRPRAWRRLDRQLGQMGTPTIDAGARHAQGITGGGEAAVGCQREDLIHHGVSLPSAAGSAIPSRADNFFEDR